MKMLRVMSMVAVGLALACQAFCAAPAVPVVDKVIPIGPDPVQKTAGVFFFDDLETIAALGDNYTDIGASDGRFVISTTDCFSGKKAIEQIYIPKGEMKDDPGNAGWCWRFFGDCPMGKSKIPENARERQVVAVARWYHKFPEGFKPRPDEDPAKGVHYPPKMARMSIFSGAWEKAFSYLFWIAPGDGHISLERATKAPGAHREWLPNYAAKFKFTDPINQGRWIHFEVRIELGDAGRQDKWQAWADGIMIGEATTDDMSGGWQGKGLNGMSWDCYWNGGSPVKQSRFYDDLSLSKRPMGPARTSLNPVIVTGALRDADQGDTLKSWEVEVASTVQKPLEVEKTFDGCEFAAKPAEFERETVWQGASAGDKKELTVDAKSGKFAGALAGKDKLAPNAMYTCRIRHQDSQGNWSEWSGWHAAFATDWAADTAEADKTAPKGFCLGQAAKGK